MILFCFKVQILILIYYFLVNFSVICKLIPIILPLILAIAFFTLFERKVLASMQRRRGPNITGIYGLLQAFADGLKLLTKETILPSSTNTLIFLFSPLLTFMLSLLGWAIIPIAQTIVITDTSIGILVILAISSLNVYGIIMSGWSSNSKYAFLGGLRASAQMISYEISIGLLVLPVIFLAGSTNLEIIVESQRLLYNFIPLWPSCILFFICILAETNRLPFDLPEAESELVSGYNVEYSSIIFTLFFLAEYSSIILMSALFVILFCGGWLPLFPFKVCFWIPGWIWFSLKLIFIMFVFIWVRATLPRYRFDQLVYIGWNVILPIAFCQVLLTIGLLIFFSSFYPFPCPPNYIVHLVWA